MQLMEKTRSMVKRTVDNEKGVVGYALAWMLGVPVTLLILIYLIFDR